MHYRRGHWVRSRRSSSSAGAGGLLLLVLGGFAMCVDKTEDALGCKGSSTSERAAKPRAVDRTPAAVLSTRATPDKWSEMADLFRGQDASWLVARADLALKAKPICVFRPMVIAGSTGS